VRSDISHAWIVDCGISTEEELEELGNSAPPVPAPSIRHPALWPWVGLSLITDGSTEPQKSLFSIIMPSGLFGQILANKAGSFTGPKEGTARRPFIHEGLRLFPSRNVIVEEQ